MPEKHMTEISKLMDAIEDALDGHIDWQVHRIAGVLQILDPDTGQNWILSLREPT